MLIQPHIGHFGIQYDPKFRYNHLQFLFSDKNNVNNCIDIFGSKKIQFSLYTNKRTFEYKISNKDRKILSQLVGFYNTLNSR